MNELTNRQTGALVPFSYLRFIVPYGRLGLIRINTVIIVKRLKRMGAAARRNIFPRLRIDQKIGDYRAVTGPENATEF